MYKSYKLETIYHAVDIATSLRWHWFRGHAKVIGRLEPKIFRSDMLAGVKRAGRDLGNYERSIIENYKREACRFCKLSLNGDHGQWLVQMQHYGAPTRLLDWSRSVLVALYFAVTDKLETDGELWALEPQALNGWSGLNGFVLESEAAFRYLVEEPYLREEDKDGFVAEVNKEYDGANFPRTALAIRPHAAFEKMFQQQSEFTLHPSPESGRLRIDEIELGGSGLVRYVIAQQDKENLARSLRALGITSTMLDPGLAAIGASCASVPKTAIHESIPECGGEETGPGLAPMAGT